MLNGLFVVLVQIDSLIVTLGMSTFVSGIVLWITGSNTLSGISNDLVRPVIVWRMLGSRSSSTTRWSSRWWSGTSSATRRWAVGCSSSAAAARSPG